MQGIDKTVEDIKQDIGCLSPSEVAELRAWFEEYTEELRDRQFQSGRDVGGMASHVETDEAAHLNERGKL